MLLPLASESSGIGEVYSDDKLLPNRVWFIGNKGSARAYNCGLRQKEHQTSVELRQLQKNDDNSTINGVEYAPDIKVGQLILCDEHGRRKNNICI